MAPWRDTGAPRACSGGKKRKPPESTTGEWTRGTSHVPHSHAHQGNPSLHGEEASPWERKSTAEPGTLRNWSKAESTWCRGQRLGKGPPRSRAWKDGHRGLRGGRRGRREDRGGGRAAREPEAQRDGGARDGRQAGPAESGAPRCSPGRRPEWTRAFPPHRQVHKRAGIPTARLSPSHGCVWTPSK